MTFGNFKHRTQSNTIQMFKIVQEKKKIYKHTYTVTQAITIQCSKTDTQHIHIHNCALNTLSLENESYHMNESTTGI